MNYYERARQARNPGEAVLVLAAGIDAIIGLLQTQPEPADPWGEWAPEPFAASKAVASQPQIAKALAMDEMHQRDAARKRDLFIATLRDKLAAETDGEERLALEARLRLLTDDGQSLEVGPDHGVREQVNEAEGVVNIPPPTPERQADRIRWAQANNLHEFSKLPAEEFYPAYGKGGPMWMYAGNRDGVMEMNYNLRRALVLDVMQDSDAAAQEMGRDILKDTGTGNREVALDGINP